MSDLPLISRSPELMSRSDSALLVVDVQEKLVAAMGGGGADCMERAAADRRRQGAWPAGAGHASSTPRASALRSPNWRRVWNRGRPNSVSVVGSCRSCLRTSGRGTSRSCWSAGSKPTSAFSKPCSICWPTVGGCTWPSMRWEHGTSSITKLLCGGWNPPAPCSRRTEAALLEWCQAAGTPEFKQISRIVRETEPL